MQICCASSERLSRASSARQSRARLMTERFELYDDNVDDTKMTQEEISLNETELLAGLLELGGQSKATYTRKIQIKRSGKLKLEFRIRALSEDETENCIRQATKFAPYRAGQPKKAIETNKARFRSYVIYTATIAEDRAKTWDNLQAQERLGIAHGVDMIDMILFAGEKDRVIDVIEEISGFSEDLESIAQD